ncbi:hypothetical protein IRP62_11925 (plasmid) [Clostridium botulinum]|uniref:hypothetical protein n=1 Tax=Clostridium botulinum C phage TaxID=12336 RepID=UPI00005DB563|nr:hypothetical protein [Clostridium botulinum]YP_398586.1 hypothetical protein CST156 [Clostridium phage c-st]QPW54305.1 hypothetical protein IRP62_11925 [Clostridium botulinum]BAE47854.1 hypothetical protein CST156 [Clostridium phage c-st]
MIGKQLQNIQIKYDSIATPPFILDIHKIYNIEYIEDDIYIVNGNYKHLVNKELILQYFSPTNSTWDEILKEKEKPKKTIKKKEIVKETKEILNEED